MAGATMSAELGERVIATMGAFGNQRRGVVTAVLRGSFLQPNPQYLVHFDGDKGPSGPCYLVAVEKTRDVF